MGWSASPGCALTASYDPRVQSVAASWLSRNLVGVPSLCIFALARTIRCGQVADPKEAKELIDKLMPNGPMIIIQGGALLVQGNPDQVKQIKDLLSKAFGA